ncbi:glutamine amidotransferase [Acidimangrovimonas pyrenivorans]|uniref:Glutamine amidotransferase n=1 Tax=Acidimangrovimonas pyrenivorans TaxID=2030798 RepID=A0ABV7AM12_9RHOB
MNWGTVIFAPFLPWPVLWAALAVAVVTVMFAGWRGLSGWGLRGLTALVLLTALANPSLQTEDRQPLSDIVLLVTDRSASQKIGDREAQTSAAVAAVKAKIAALPNTELRQVTVGDAPGDGGTLAMGALSGALAEEPRGRVAGEIVISDGQVHDMAQTPDLPAPLNLLMTGHETDWDRRLTIKDAPAFAIMGEPVTLTLRIEDQGKVPAGLGKSAPLEVSIDGGEPQSYDVPVGEDISVPVTLPHGGMNALQFRVAAQPGELTDRNNAAVVQINGVRDRLRVLLVSGEPHAGERVWRNLLKSDSSVDLVHFTILRPPEKQDGVPVSELSLIAFPTRELFIDKIDQFDLIIFDRYRRRGILPSAYLDNVKNYVENGGAVLVAAGPEFGSADSLWRSPLADILPVTPSSRVLVQGFKPEITKLGQRHPVTEGLAAFGPKPKPGEKGPGWGRWFRQIEMEARGGQTVMSGIDGKPLLVLDRVGKGRVAMLASDQAWLWSRGYEGGGPQLELLRRLAHWMMKEPELEEEALTATAEGQTVTITRRSLSEGHDAVTITGPDGKLVTVPLTETEPGKFTATWTAPDMGLYRLAEGDQKAVIAVGPSAPREFAETIATSDKLAPALAQHRGGAVRLEDGMPDIRQVGEGRVAAGRGWIGITPRHAYVTRDLRVMPLLPAWALLLLAALLAIGAWLREGRR